jgi:DNA-binding NarL/FixJ family response regulator/MinD-like ATPase involved in chromosome partitioning or flagellar assembly
MSPSESSTCIVLIEDNPKDAERIRQALAEIKDISLRIQAIGGMSTALARAAGGGIDLILLSLSCAGDSESGKIENLRKLRIAAPEAPVLVLSESREEELARRTMREGAENYFVKWEGPVDGLAHFVRSALERNRNRTHFDALVRPALKPATGKVISFIGSKGGVGTTTVALNVAAGLAREATVILVEATPSRGLLAQYFRQHGPATSSTGLTRHEQNPAREEAGSALRPCLALPNLHALLDSRGPRDCLENPLTVTEALIKTLSEMADYVVFDLSAEAARSAQCAIRQSDSTCLVIEREAVALNAAKWVLGLFQTWGVAREQIGAVLVNRSSWINPPPLQQIQQQLGQDILGMIPAALEECIRSFEIHEPLVCCEPESMAASGFAELTSYFAKPVTAKVPPVRQPRPLQATMSY